MNFLNWTDGQKMFAGSVRVEIQSTVEVLVEDGEEWFVEPAVGRAGDRVAEVDPNAVADTVAVVVDVPGSNRFPKG